MRSGTKKTVRNKGREKQTNWAAGGDSTQPTEGKACTEQMLEVHV